MALTWNLPEVPATGVFFFLCPVRRDEASDCTSTIYRGRRTGVQSRAIQGNPRHVHTPYAVRMEVLIRRKLAMGAASFCHKAVTLSLILRSERPLLPNPIK